MLPTLVILPLLRRSAIVFLTFERDMSVGFDGVRLTYLRIVPDHGQNDLGVIETAFSLDGSGEPDDQVVPVLDELRSWQSCGHAGVHHPADAASVSPDEAPGLEHRCQGLVAYLGTAGCDVVQGRRPIRSCSFCGIIHHPTRHQQTGRRNSNTSNSSVEDGLSACFVCGNPTNKRPLLMSCPAYRLCRSSASARSFKKLQYMSKPG